MQRASDMGTSRARVTSRLLYSREIPASSGRVLCLAEMRGIEKGLTAASRGIFSGPDTSTRKVFARETDTGRLLRTITDYLFGD